MARRASDVLAIETAASPHGAGFSARRAPADLLIAPASAFAATAALAATTAAAGSQLSDNTFSACAFGAAALLSVCSARAHCAPAGPTLFN